MVFVPFPYVLSELFPWWMKIEVVMHFKVLTHVLVISKKTSLLLSCIQEKHCICKQCPYWKNRVCIAGKPAEMHTQGHLGGLGLVSPGDIVPSLERDYGKI